MSTLTASELSRRLESPEPPVLIHVLPPESWDCRRIAGSQCACVYEMTFLGNAHKLSPDKTREVVVYGAGRPSLDSQAAAEKLIANGYTAVLDFEGGLKEWQAAGLAVEGCGEEPPASDFNGRWKADPEASVIRWTGRNLFNDHEGTVALKSGSFEIQDGELKHAEFTVDLRKIACRDLTDPEMNAMLLRHLADRDFFETAKFPEAVFKATSARPIAEVTPGLPNFDVEGTLELRGVTHPLSFRTLVAVDGKGGLTAQAWLEFDRTLWGANYGSGRLFAWLGKHVVNDLVGIQLKIQARRDV